MGFASKSYYEILDIDPAATAEEVQKSYAAIKATWTPGSIATYSLYSPAESDLISRKIEEAFQLLTDPARRRRYDLYRRYMDGGRGEVRTPEEFWSAVEEASVAEGEGLDRLTELLTTGAVEEVEEPAASPASDAARRIASRPDVEREWGELVDGRGPKAPGRAAAAMAPPFREPPVAKTWVSPTAENVSPGAGWRRPDRLRGASPRPTRLHMRPLADDALSTLEATHGLTGALLSAVREARGLTIEAIAEHTKIGSTYLRDIEREDFGSLPAAVYLRGFVHQYVKLLRLDVGRVVEAYMARFEAATRPTPDPL